MRFVQPWQLPPSVGLAKLVSTAQVGAGVNVLVPVVVGEGVELNVAVGDWVNVSVAEVTAKSAHPSNSTSFTQSERVSAYGWANWLRRHRFEKRAGKITVCL